MVPQHLRVLAYLSWCTGWMSIDLRSLALATGLDYRYLCQVLSDLESAGLVLIDHGRPDTDPAGPRPNAYLVSAEGRNLIPEVLRSRLTGNHALNHPMWAAKGFNLHGLIVTLTLGPGFHEMGSAEVASILGIDRRQAIKRLKTWSDRGWASRLDRSTYLVWAPSEDPEEDMLDMSQYVPDEALASQGRKQDWIFASRAAAKVVREVIKEFGYWVPAALRRVREASVEVMTEFLDSVWVPLRPPPPVWEGRMTRAEALEFFRAKGVPITDPVHP